MSVKFTPKEQEKLNLMFEEWMVNDFKRKTENFIELNKSIKPGKIVFAGDSITEGYPLNELFDYNDKIYNRGISGITSSQLLENINVQILDLKPKKVFLLIGTNDLVRDQSPQDIVDNIKLICKIIKDELPKTEVFILSVYPVNEEKAYNEFIGERTNKAIKSINIKIADFTKEISNLEFVDLYDYLIENGNLNPRYTYDGLHLNIKGYRAVTDKLFSYLN